MNNPFQTLADKESASDAMALAQAFKVSHSADEVGACLRFLIHRESRNVLGYLYGKHFDGVGEDLFDVAIPGAFSKLKTLAIEYMNTVST